MSKVIRIEEETFARLQGLAEPLIDTPSSVIKTLLDYYESSSSLEPISVDTTPAPKKPNLFLAPSILENINRTISQSVNPNEFEHLISKKEIKLLKDSTNDLTSLHCFAMTENKRSTFESMRDGDIVLFTIKNTGKFAYYGEVTCKTDNERLGNHLWDIVLNKPWRLIYFLRNIRTIDVDKSLLVSTLSYQSNYAVNGVIKVRNIKLDIALNRYGNIENMINAISN
jgi:hypothetical protein